MRKWTECNEPLICGGQLINLPNIFIDDSEKIYIIFIRNEKCIELMKEMNY